MDRGVAIVPRRDAFRINGLEFDESCSPVEGTVKWDTVRSLFNGSMLAAALVLGPMYFTWTALLVFLALAAVHCVVVIPSAFIGG